MYNETADKFANGQANPMQEDQFLPSDETALPGKSKQFEKTMRRTRLIAAACLIASGGLITGAAVGSRGPADQYGAEGTVVDTGSEDLLSGAPALQSGTAGSDTQTAAIGPNDIDLSEPAAVLAPPKEVTRVLAVGKGDTLMGMLTNAGIDRRIAHDAIAALSTVFSPRKLRPGHELYVTMMPETEQADPAQSGVAAGIEAMQLVSLRLPETPIRDVQVSRLDDGAYEAEALEKTTEMAPTVASGHIQTSLYEAALDAGVPATVLNDLIQIFSFDIDFQREVQKGDKFALLYDLVTADGAIVDTGAIQVAEMTVRGELHRYYRFKDEHGFWDYFDEKGQSVRKALLRTPIDGARLTSGFGKRKHPILGYTKMHRGVDFAAPTGTPIYAAGDGTVEVAGRNGGYGNYIRIRHNGTYKTAYAHLSRIKVKKGSHVRQGQVIGMVGTTGRSTGPHLHYEVHQNNKQTNPLSVKLPTGKKLTGNQLAAFKKRQAELDSQYAKLDTSSSDVATAAGEQ
ncbi:M23 family metallopeptidase [Hwanghaeella grinnelliae]|uniref:M23 family metallopeptidase n=1 Tax=Hwanghaeella grinnelliae TaxID=2500179 RepID=UPI001EFFBB33|nr:peptidoglycan DD-metalloendopeptidase family protein [Hwanghaeella grinnelliae]